MIEIASENLLAPHTLRRTRFHRATVVPYLTTARLSVFRVAAHTAAHLFATRAR
jgi:hypothetical protein